MAKSWREHRTYAQEQMVIDLTKDHCQREIAEIVGISKGSVLHVQRKYHLVLSFGARHHSSMFRWRIDESLWGPIMEELYSRQRLSIVEIARQCNLGVKRTRTILTTLGFEIRTPGQSNRGKKRKRYNYRPDCPTCICGVKIIKPGESYCAACRSRPNRLKQYASEAEDQLAA